MPDMKNSPNKKIQIYPTIKNLHTAWRSMISDPPEGYAFIGSEDSIKSRIVYFLKQYKLIRIIYKIYLKTFNSLKVLESINKTEILPESELILSTGTLYYGNKPWIIDIIDIPYCMAGNKKKLFLKNRKKIEEVLSRKNCRKIVCANESSIKIMKKYFPKKVTQKITLIRPAIKKNIFPPVDKKKSIKNRKIQILFIGSINNPEDFYMKGGYEAIKTFEYLNKKRKNIQLVVRCKVPDDIKQEIKNISNIKLIDKKISLNDLTEIYSSSDILLMPSHTYVLMAFLEAMYFGLPIIGIDTYAVKDYIIDGYNGFVVQKSKKLKAYSDPDYPNNLREKDFFKEVKNVDEDLIKRLAEKVELLIDRPNLMKKIGANGKKIIRSKFSVKTRNTAWKKLFDQELKT